MDIGWLAGRIGKGGWVDGELGSGVWASGKNGASDSLSD